MTSLPPAQSTGTGARRGVAQLLRPQAAHADGRHVMLSHGRAQQVEVMM